jgi:multisubunit Na+/H+ antiporter MnhG subunit
VRSAAYLPKLILVLLMLWVGSPIASHLVSRMEYRTGKDAGQHFRKEDRS